MIKDQIQHKSQSLLNLARGYFSSKDGTSSVKASHWRHVKDRGGASTSFVWGVCGHRNEKLTHLQTQAGTKTDPFSDYLQ